MTREEILEQLESIVYAYEIILGNGVNSDVLEIDDIEAIKEVIEALEQEPVLDKIRAEIEDLDRFYDNDYSSENRDSMFKCNDVMQILDKYKAEMFRNGCLESIEALMAEGEIYDIEYSHWIPVSERLPQRGRVVLWCNDHGSVFTSEITYQNGATYSVGQHSGKMVAWMPLPESYKGERSDK